MYQPAQVSLADFLGQSGAESGGFNYGGGGAFSAPNLTSAGGPGINDFAGIGKLAFKYGLPETYGSLTNWLPSMSEVASGLGLDGIGASLGLDGLFSGGGAAGGAMGAGAGAMAAMGYGGIAYAVAQFLKSLNDSTDHSVSLAQGESTGLGGLTNEWAARPEDRTALNGLYDAFKGDGSWHEGGDPSKVGNLTTAYGLIQPMKGDKRNYYSVGGAPYEFPGLAVSSGRQIAQSQMGLPVEYEDLSRYRNGVPNRDLPVYDGEAQLPHDWDARMDWAQGNFGSGEGQSGPDPGWGTISEGYDGSGPLVEGYGDMAGKPRMQEWANTGFSLGEMYALTGPNSPDYMDVDLSGARDETLNRVAAAAGIDNAAPFDPFTYGLGPARNFFPGMYQPTKTGG